MRPTTTTPELTRDARSLLDVLYQAWHPRAGQELERIMGEPPGTTANYGQPRVFRQAKLQEVYLYPSTFCNR